MDEQNQQTLVTRAPDEPRAPREGDVVGGRYRLLVELNSGPFTHEFQAQDISDATRQMLVHVVGRDLIRDEIGGRGARNRLKSVLGASGRYLSKLEDAIFDNGQLVVAEPVPAGTSLRALLDQKKLRRKRLSPADALPIAARLDAALKAIPAGWCHGNVRAENVWLEAKDLQLSGAMLVPSLPGREVTQALRANPDDVHLYAPEVMDGRLSVAGDLYGVGVLIYEALVGEVPDRDAPPLSRLGAVGPALHALLASQPGNRPRGLDPLLKALAKEARVEIPSVQVDAVAPSRKADNAALPNVRDTAPHRALSDSHGSLRPVQMPLTERPTAADERTQPRATYPSPPPGHEGENGERTVVMAAPTLSLSTPAPSGAAQAALKHSALEQPALKAPAPSPALHALVPARVVPGASDEGTQELRMEDMQPSSEEGTQPRIPGIRTRTKDTPVSDDGLDPRLVRAALDVQLENSPPHGHAFKGTSANDVTAPRTPQRPASPMDAAANRLPPAPAAAELKASSERPIPPRFDVGSLGPRRDQTPLLVQTHRRTAGDVPAPGDTAQRWLAPPAFARSLGPWWIVVMAVVAGALIIGATWAYKRHREREEHENRVQELYERARREVDGTTSDSNSGLERFAPAGTAGTP